MSSSNEHVSTPSGSTSSASASSSIRVFLPPSSSSSTPYPAILPASDDELKPTPEELKVAFRSTLLGRHGPDAPLLTRAMREKEEARLGLNSSRNRTWEQVRIRIRFSDRTMIESTLRESDTIDAVYAFLETSLADTARAKGVVIYTAPPKVEYKRGDKKVQGKTLRQLGLIPSAVVSLRWEDASMNSNTFPAPLQPHLLQQAQPLAPPPSFDPPPSTPASAAAAAATSNATGTDGKEAKPMPKWLKNIVKK